MFAYPDSKGKNMDFGNIKCAQCLKPLENGADSVICPECGAPYHLSCYESLGSCKYDAKHKEGFEYSREDDDDGDYIKCPKCGLLNASGTFYCKKCGEPIIFKSSTEPPPFVQGNAPAGSPFIVQELTYDPDEVISENVTAGDLAKYTKVNYPYYLGVFKSLKITGKARANLSACLFSAGWLLYRKMYKLGAIIAAIMAPLLAASGFLSLYYSMPLLNKIFEEYDKSFSDKVLNFPLFTEITAKLGFSVSDYIFLLLPYILNIIMISIMIILGVKANKLYLKHCTRKIREIKTNSKDEKVSREQLQTAGGVNITAAACSFVCYMIISYSSLFFS